MDRVQLRLYVRGNRVQRDAAIAAVELLRAELSDETDLEIVDVLERPDLAEEERVIVTPTLDRIHPFNSRRTVGDLSDIVVVARHLGLTLRSTPEQAPASS